MIGLLAFLLTAQIKFSILCHIFNIKVDITSLLYVEYGILHGMMRLKIFVMR